MSSVKSTQETTSEDVNQYLRTGRIYLTVRRLQPERRIKKMLKYYHCRRQSLFFNIPPISQKLQWQNTST